MDLEGYKIRD